MAFLNITSYDKQEVRCGGILISENFVLTAAHCKGSKIVVTLGAHNIDEREESQQKIDVCEQIQHPLYKNDDSKDIMLLKLRRKAVPNQHVLPIRLSQSGPKLKTGDLCNVAGWGRINKFNYRMASKLQELDMKVVAPDECTKAFPNYNTKELICAQNFTEPKSSCWGDSGGPLFCDQYLHGLVYGGKGDCGGPRLFTSVFSYIKWINSSLKKPKCKIESY
ncbi:hypothetical protein XELAEV_18010302mg [Xenopus laevis]|nr:hypothetical protein XELAEV_18010302mg [Xenopus laevis]